MRCVVIDDDNVARLSIIQCIDRSADLECIGDYSDPVLALKEVNKSNPDIIFLDVEMPELTGLEFISGVQVDSQIIIISSKKDYAAEAFDFNVSDYITKPITFDRFCKAIDKVRKINEFVTQESTNKKNLFIKADSKLVKIELSEILFIEALSDYISIHTTKGRFVILGTMKGILAKLDVNAFIRVHRSYIVNINAVETIQESVISIGKHAIPISRNSKENLMSKIDLLN